MADCTKFIFHSLLALHVNNVYRLSFAYITSVIAVIVNITKALDL